MKQKQDDNVLIQTQRLVLAIKDYGDTNRKLGYAQAKSDEVVTVELFSFLKVLVVVFGMWLILHLFID